MGYIQVVAAYVIAAPSITEGKVVSYDHTFPLFWKIIFFSVGSVG
jgi:hypothetical protein